MGGVAAITDAMLRDVPEVYAQESVCTTVSVDGAQDMADQLSGRGKTVLLKLAFIRLHKVGRMIECTQMQLPTPVSHKDAV